MFKMGINSVCWTLQCDKMSVYYNKMRIPERPHMSSATSDFIKIARSRSSKAHSNTNYSSHQIANDKPGLSFSMEDEFVPRDDDIRSMDLFWISRPMRENCDHENGTGL